MKVAMVSEHASPLAALGGADAGGQNVHVGALATELVGRGLQVVVYTRRDDPALAPRVRTPGGVIVDHVDAGPPLDLGKDELRPLMDDFAEILRHRWGKDRPDVVHAHFWMSGVAARQAAGPFAIPVIQTFHALGAVKRRHQGRADRSPADRLQAERRLISAADHIIATCFDEADELRRLGADPVDVSVIPSGVDLRLFGPDGPVASRRASPRHRLVVVGRLVERKGVADVIEALRWLPGTELLIAGGPAVDRLDDDADVGRLRATAVRHAVSERVRFLGRVGRSDLPALIRSADAVVSVPYYEPFGIVPLEAMACGVPVVVSAVGGLRESVVDGETGLHVPPGDPRTLSEVLSALLADPVRAKSLGAGGVLRAQGRYGWPRIATMTEAVYAEVACRLRARPPQAVR